MEDRLRSSSTTNTQMLVLLSFVKQTSCGLAKSYTFQQLCITIENQFFG